MNSRTHSHTLSRFLFSRSPFAPVFLAPDDGANDPGGDNNNPPAPPAGNPPAGKSVAEQVQEAIAELLGKKGNDPMAAMDTLIRQNHALEQRAKTAEASLPSKADRDLLAAFKALNLKPDEVKQITAEHQQWASERARNAKRDSLKKAAEKEGYNADLLASLEGALDPEYSVIGEGENAKAVVKVKNGETVSDKPLNDWIAEKWPALVDALKVAPSNAPRGGQKVVTPYPRSAAPNSGKDPSLAERIRAEEGAQKTGLLGTSVVAKEGEKAPAAPQTLAERMGVRR